MPSSSPSNCLQIIINSTSVNLTWSAPIKKNWNGLFSGYNITCIKNDTEFQTSYWALNTFVTLNDLPSLSYYKCYITFVNEVGSGPSLMCGIYSGKYQLIM